MSTMNVITEIDRWLKKTGMKPSRLGLLTTANPKAVERVRNGTAQVKTLEAILAYIRSHPNGEG